MFEYAISAGEGTLLQHGIGPLSTVNEKVEALAALGETSYSVTIAPSGPTPAIVALWPTPHAGQWTPFGTQPI